MPDQDRLKLSDVFASVVVYKNDARELSALLNSVLTSSIPIRVIVVDNSPSNELGVLVEGLGAVYIWNGRNLGFGAGHNIALRRTLSSAKYHLALNPDITFKPDVVENLYRFMERHPDMGLVMPQILYSDGSEQRLCKLLPTPFDLFLRRFLGSFGKVFFRNLWDRYELRNLNLNMIREVPSLSGCFMFMRTSVLQEVGIFDERYFMYLEDVDLCRRIGRVSQTVFYPDVSVIHGYTKGSYKNARLLKHHLLSAVKYFSKWGWFFDSERVQLNQKTKVLELDEISFSTH
jgi:GT2 family glycosyltransferase